MLPTICKLGGRARRSHGEGNTVWVGGVVVTVLRLVAGQWWRRGGGEDYNGASRCWLHPSLDRIGFVGGCGGSR